MDFKDLKAALSDDILTEFCESLHNTSSQCVYTIGKFTHIYQFEEKKTFDRILLIY